MHLLYITTNQDCESPKLPCNIAVVASPPPRLQLAHFLVAVELLMDWFGGRFNWASQLLAGRLPPLFLKQCCIVNSPIRGGISPQMVHQTML